MDDHCSNDWAARVGAAWGDAEDAGQGKLEKAAGHTIVKLAPAQLEQWKKAPSRCTGSGCRAVDKAGVNGRQALEELRKEISSRGAD
jgi:hypothetical protein